MSIAKLKDYLQTEPARYNQPSAKALNYYVTRFMLMVSFEDIDVRNGRPVSVSINALFNKIVHDKCDGSCYELSVFFKAYLQQKGFSPGLMSAAIHTSGGGHSQNGSHASLVVSINNVFCVTDVGFGDLPLNTIPTALPDDTQQATDINGAFHATFNNEDKDIFYV